MLQVIKEAFSKDEEVDRAPLFGSPLIPFMTIIAYLIIVLKIGPEFMKDRKPFKLNNVIIIHNLIQVTISLNLVVRAILHAMEAGYWNDTCLFNIPHYRTLCIHASQLYFVAKYVELLDTVFFVLRKKDSQVSFLHVYHHASMIVTVYLVGKFAMSEKYIYSGALNSAVHVVMYSYYALAAMGPHMAKYLWWKKYITKLQMTSFVLMVIDQYIRHYTSPCPQHYLMYAVATFQVIANLVLFSIFYKKSYKSKPQDPIRNSTNERRNTSIYYKKHEKVF